MGAMGAPVAIESSSIALMSSDLSKLPFLFTLSAKTDLRIRINIGISLFILLVGLLLSSLGWLSPVLAAVLHNVSALFILFNSAQLIKNSPEASPPA
jgi:cation transport ATPase